MDSERLYSFTFYFIFIHFMDATSVYLVMDKVSIFFTSNHIDNFLISLKKGIKCLFEGVNRRGIFNFSIYYCFPKRLKQVSLP